MTPPMYSDWDWDDDDDERPTRWYLHPITRWVVVLVVVALFLSQIIGRFG